MFTWGNGAGMGPALVSGVYVAAVVLGIGALGEALLRQPSRGKRVWGLDDDERLFLRRALRIGCAAGLLFLAPRQVLLTTAFEPLPTAGSQTLARLLLLAFQSVVFLLTLRAGWPSSPLMARVLAGSRDRDGLLWRLWPFLHALLLTPLAAGGGSARPAGRRARHPQQHH